MDSIAILLKCLKKKRVINSIEVAEKESFTEAIELKTGDDLFIRDAITGFGTILEENLEMHYYITTVMTGAFSNCISYAIIMRKEENAADIAVYAHEGLIKQHLAEKALAQLKKALCAAV